MIERAARAEKRRRSKYHVCVANNVPLHAIVVYLSIYLQYWISFAFPVTLDQDCRMLIPDELSHGDLLGFNTHYSTVADANHRHLLDDPWDLDHD